MLFPFYFNGEDELESSVSRAFGSLIGYWEDEQELADRDSKLTQHDFAKFKEYYIHELCNKLKAEKIIVHKDIIDKELSTFLTNREIQGIDLCDHFRLIIDALRNEKRKRIGNNVMRCLLYGDKNDIELSSMTLLRVCGVNPDNIVDLFMATNKMKERHKYQSFLYTVCHTGMHGIMKRIIENNKYTLTLSEIAGVRAYCETFRIIVTLLRCSTCKHDERVNIYNLLAVMQVSFEEGRISREYEFYSDDSLYAMSKAGTSYNMSKKWKNKEPLYEKAIEVAEKLWQKGDESYHNEMAKYLAALDEFSGLYETTLRRRLIPVAGKYGKTRGVKK